MKHAIFVEKTNNKKLSSYKDTIRVCTTYASIEATCPLDCELRETQECYGMHGHVGMINRRLGKGVTSKDAMKVAREEARMIKSAFDGGEIPQDGANGGRDLRLHTVGDCRTNGAAKILASAADDWVKRGGGKVWTYTHAWKKIKRSSWGRNISVLASLDNPDDAKKALRARYIPAKYVSEFRSRGLYNENGITWLPCRAQYHDDVGCADCRMCMKDRLKKMKVGIVFEVHGVKINSMKERLSNG